MKDMTKELLEEVIVQQLNDLKNDYPDEEKSGKSDKVIELSKILIENDKVEKDFAERRDKRVADAEEATTARKNKEAFDVKQAKDQKIDRYIGYAINAVSIAAPLVFYGSWMKKGFKFEETGTFTSTTFRGLFGQFKPKR